MALRTIFCLLKLFLAVAVASNQRGDGETCDTTNCEIYQKTTDVQLNVLGYEAKFEKVENELAKLNAGFETKFDDIEEKLANITTALRTQIERLTSLVYSTGISDCSDRPTYTGVTLLIDDTRVFCNGGWTGFMSVKLEDKLDVYKPMIDYEYGFGDAYSSYWAGLKPLARMLDRKNTKWQLRLNMTRSDAPYTNISGVYNDFQVDANKNYRLQLGSFIGEARYNLLNCDAYSSNWKQNDNNFNARDCGSHSSCADDDRKGAFWYSYSCGHLRHFNYNDGRVGECYPCESAYSFFNISRLHLEVHPLQA